MFCPKCGYDLPDEALFCPDCGAERPVLQELERGETSLQTEQTSGAEQALSGSEMPNTTSYKEECDTSAFIMPTGQPKHTSKKARVIGVIIGAIVGAIIAGTIGFLLMHRIVPGSVPDYYGMYSDDIGWGLVITDEKTFTGDSSKRDETYMYIYSLQSGKTGQAFVISTDFGRETITSFSADFDVVGKSGYYVFVEVEFQEPGIIIVNFPNDQKSIRFERTSKNVKKAMSELTSYFGHYTLYEAYIESLAASESFTGDNEISNPMPSQNAPEQSGPPSPTGTNDDDYSKNIPVVTSFVDPSDFVGEYQGDSDFDSLTIDWSDYMLTINCGAYRQEIMSDVQVDVSYMSGNQIAFIAYKEISGDPFFVTLTYVPKADSPFNVDTIYMDSIDHSMIYKRTEDSYYFAGTDGTDTGFLFPSDTRYITYSDLDQFTREEVTLIRNEIYARYGYSFQSENIRSYFESQSWYYADPSVNSSTFSESMLNDYERTNLETILSYEREMGWK